MRSIGMDVHRSFAQIAVVEDGVCRDEGKISQARRMLLGLCCAIGRTARTPPRGRCARGVCQRLRPFSRASLLTGPGEVGHRTMCDDTFLAEVPAEGRRVLLLDDAYTTDGTALSAVFALQLAGVVVAAVLVVGRRLNPDPAIRSKAGGGYVSKSGASVSPASFRSRFHVDRKSVV